MTSLGTLSIHLDGAPCQMGCDFCYLGSRSDAAGAKLPQPLVAEALGRLRYDEVAVALSEAAEAPILAAIVAAARAPVAVTTTPQIARRHPELFAGVGRLNLSIDS